MDDAYGTREGIADDPVSGGSRYSGRFMGLQVDGTLVRLWHGDWPLRQNKSSRWLLDTHSKSFLQTSRPISFCHPLWLGRFPVVQRRPAFRSWLGVIRSLRRAFSQLLLTLQ
jgi:hypothetical protein